MVFKIFQVIKTPVGVGPSTNRSQLVAEDEPIFSKDNKNIPWYIAEMSRENRKPIDHIYQKAQIPYDTILDDIFPGKFKGNLAITIPPFGISFKNEKKVINELYDGASKTLAPSCPLVLQDYYRGSITDQTFEEFNKELPSEVVRDTSESEDDLLELKSEDDLRKLEPDFRISDRSLNVYPKGKHESKDKGSLKAFLGNMISQRLKVRVKTEQSWLEDLEGNQSESSFYKMKKRVKRLKKKLFPKKGAPSSSDALDDDEDDDIDYFDDKGGLSRFFGKGKKPHRKSSFRRSVSLGRPVERRRSRASVAYLSFEGDMRLGGTLGSIGRSLFFNSISHSHRSSRSLSGSPSRTGSRATIRTRKTPSRSKSIAIPLWHFRELLRETLPSKPSAADNQRLMEIAKYRERLGLPLGCPVTYQETFCNYPRWVHDYHRRDQTEIAERIKAGYSALDDEDYELTATLKEKMDQVRIGVATGKPYGPSTKDESKQERIKNNYIFKKIMKIEQERKKKEEAELMKRATKNVDSIERYDEAMLDMKLRAGEKEDSVDQQEEFVPKLETYKKGKLINLEKIKTTSKQYKMDDALAKEDLGRPKDPIAEIDKLVKRDSDGYIADAKHLGSTHLSKSPRPSPSPARRLHPQRLSSERLSSPRRHRPGTVGRRSGSKGTGKRSSDESEMSGFSSGDLPVQEIKHRHYNPKSRMKGKLKKKKLIMRKSKDLSPFRRKVPAKIPLALATKDYPPNKYQDEWCMKRFANLLFTNYDNESQLKKITKFRFGLTEEIPNKEIAPILESDDSSHSISIHSFSTVIKF